MSRLPQKKPFNRFNSPTKHTSMPSSINAKDTPDAVKSLSTERDKFWPLFVGRLNHPGFNHLCWIGCTNSKSMTWIGEDPSDKQGFFLVVCWRLTKLNRETFFNCANNCLFNFNVYLSRNDPQ